MIKTAMDGGKTNLYTDASLIISGNQAAMI
jgi:hypothetical protein